tara:strand:- start:478 stop:1041 length:564 start_codon:yes stop_codon:yes gene_type:complete
MPLQCKQLSFVCSKVLNPRDMSTETSNDQSQNRKQLLKSDLKQGLEGLKEIFVAAVALLINISENFPISKASSALSSFKQRSARKESEIALSFLQKTNNQTQPVDVSIEVEEPNQEMTPLLFAKNLLYPCLAIISTTALVIGVAKIEPLTKWAQTQNECIENTKTIDGFEPADLATKVMNCNGGHAF